MDGSYLAIYEAVRSRISGFDGQVLADRIASQFDFSHHAQIVSQEFANAAYEMQRPSVLFRPKVFIDGNQWCALYGENIQDGVAGFGPAPDAAMRDFDKNWTRVQNLNEALKEK